MQICSSNNSFNKINIPISDSNRHLVSLTPEFLLSKYGIHADVVLISDENVISGGHAAGGRAADLSFPYSLFHTFFSLFSVDKPSGDDNVSDVDFDNVSDKLVVNVVVVEPIDKPVVDAAVVDAAVVEPIVDAAVVEPIVDDEPVDVKSIEITIHSIDGIRNW